MITAHIVIWLTFFLSLWGITKINDGGKLHCFLWITFKISIIAVIFSVYALGFKVLAFLAGY